MGFLIPMALGCAISLAALHVGLWQYHNYLPRPVAYVVGTFTIGVWYSTWVLVSFSNIPIVFGFWVIVTAGGVVILICWWVRLVAAAHDQAAFRAGQVDGQVDEGTGGADYECGG